MISPNLSKSGGKFSKPINQTTLQNLLNKKLRVEESFLLTGGNSEVSTIATLSGAASRDVLQEAASLGVDLLITGERSEFYHDAQDYGISVLFMGHNASETVGVKALMRKAFSPLAVSTSSNKSASPPSSISEPASRVRSLKRHRCGEL